MAEVTNISWCDHTFNPWLGCERISPACDLCYAATWAKRAGHPELWQGERRRTTPANWREPIRWDAAAAAAGVRRRVFCASLADVFDNEVDPKWRADLLLLILSTPNLDWLLLTKRIGNARRMLNDATAAIQDMWTWDEGPWPNVWIGSTIANQAEADRDIPKLLATPARVRFLSCEPLLGSLDLSAWLQIESVYTAGNPWRRRTKFGEPDADIHWVIAGGESGGKARPSHPDWFRSLRDQCAAAGVAFHHKQHGEWIEAHERTGEVYSDQAEYEQMAAECDGFISLDGHFVRSLDDAREDAKYRGMKRAGKKAAGRTLDGVIHDAFPELK